MWYCPWCFQPHCTPPPLVQVPSYGIPLYWVPAPPSSVQGPGLRFSDNDIWWSRLDTCSNLYTWGPHSTVSPEPTHADTWWLATYGGQEGGTDPSGMLSWLLKSSISTIESITNLPLVRCRISQLITQSGSTLPVTETFNITVWTNIGFSSK